VPPGFHLLAVNVCQGTHTKVKQYYRLFFFGHVTHVDQNDFEMTEKN